MTNRIPSSLNWLIDKRARLAGEIQRTKKTLLKVQHLVNKLKELETALEAIDKSLGLHEIQIDIQNIKPIKSHRFRSKFQHGEINNLVLSYLISKSGEDPISKSDILEYINLKHLEIDPEPLSYIQLSHCVKRSLNRLLRLNCISRCHHPITNQIGHWRVNEKY